MLLGEWRKTAPSRESLSNKVMVVLKPVLADLGADADPDCWVLWGEDPEFKFSVMVPTPAGLITVAVRPNVGASDGPRATGKLIRWSKLVVGEMSIEAAGGHRIVAIPVEGQVLKGSDEEADRICEFCRGLLAGIDGRAYQAPAAAVYQAVPAGAPAVAATPRPAAPVPAAKVPAPKAPVRPGLKALPAPAAAGLEDIEEIAGGEVDEEIATPAAPQPKPARTPALKPQPAWVPPHPIVAPARPVQQTLLPPVLPPAAQPATQPVAQPAAQAAAQPAAAAKNGTAKPPAAPAVHPAPARPAPEPAPIDGGPVWDVPPAPEPQPRDSKRPRTWAP
jgi:hypothetical protein